MTIGERIAKIRRERGMTQTDLGNRIGVTKQTICSYERRGNMHPSTVSAIADALGVSRATLLGIPEDAATIDPVLGYLDDRERALIADFRQLNDIGQDYVLWSVTLSLAVNRRTLKPGADD